MAPEGLPTVPRCPPRAVAVILASLCLLPWCSRQARAWQQDDESSRRILEFPNLGPVPGAPGPALGPGPGSFDAGISSGTQIIGGRRRQSILPRGKPALAAASSARGMRLPEPLPAPKAVRRTEIHAGTSALDRSLALDPGPEGGLTYDAAIERMMADNLDIRALRHEMAQADADILTAGLRTNPLVYVDTQMVPYGNWSDQRPGGPTQYDLNVTLPLDVSRKRQARTVVARMAKTALEAQFQDVVRRQIDNVAKAYVGLQATRIEVLAAEASVRQQEAILAGIDEDAREPGLSAEERRALAASRRRMTMAIEQSRSTVLEATEAFEDAQETLAVLLGVPPEATSTLVPRGSLRVDAPPPPPLDELVRLATGCRPDLQAMRIGVTRARAEVDLQRANRIDDVFLFYDPITYQDMRPYGKQDATSWAVGLTFSMPIFNRNQGNIARAESNVGQTRVETASLERRVAAEVRLAEREYRYARRQLERIEDTVFTEAEARLKQAQKEFDAGDIDFSEYEDAIEDAGAVAHERREALARYRRAMLDLNTAVGMRILP
mgnify:CR=1 FL=1